MEPIFIYFDELTFRDEKKNYLRFSQEKETKNKYFKENNNYFNTSFSYFVKLDITLPKNYKKVHELLEICRTILSSSIDAGFI